jgi:hypothetical protein
METWSEAISEFDDFLDEFGPVVIASLEYNPSRVLREVDPIAYRTMLIDYIDGCGIDSDDFPDLVSADIP